MNKTTTVAEGLEKTTYEVLKAVLLGVSTFAKSLGSLTYARHLIEGSAPPRQVTGPVTYLVVASFAAISLPNLVALWLGGDQQLSEVTKRVIGTLSIESVTVRALPLALGAFAISQAVASLLAAPTIKEKQTSELSYSLTYAAGYVIALNCLGVVVALIVSMQAGADEERSILIAVLCGSTLSGFQIYRALGVRTPRPGMEPVAAFIGSILLLGLVAVALAWVSITKPDNSVRMHRAWLSFLPSQDKTVLTVLVTNVSSDAVYFDRRIVTPTLIAEPILVPLGDMKWIGSATGPILIRSGDSILMAFESEMNQTVLDAAIQNLSWQLDLGYVNARLVSKKGVDRTPRTMLRAPLVLEQGKEELRKVNLAARPAIGLRALRKEWEVFAGIWNALWYYGGESKPARCFRGTISLGHSMVVEFKDVTGAVFASGAVREGKGIISHFPPLEMRAIDGSVFKLSFPEALVDGQYHGLMSATPFKATDLLWQVSVARDSTAPALKPKLPCSASVPKALWMY